MDDFRSYAKNNNKTNNYSDQTKNMDRNLFNLVNSLAGKFDGKSQTELMKAIYMEAKRGKENGTLSDRDIDNFVSMLAPMLDDKKRKTLYKLADEIKRI